MRKESCVVLFSGGLDSTTALGWALTRFARVFALSFDYGQRHRIELRAAARTVRRMKIPHAVLKVDLGPVGGSALTDPSLPLPRCRRRNDIRIGIPATYVPFRNGIFLSLTAAWAEARDIRDIVCGFNIIDSPDYPDTRREFVRAMQKAIRTGTRATSGTPPIRILAPFINLKKSEIIRLGLKLGIDYSTAASCYAGTEVPCRRCSACILRREAWREAGEKDHLEIRLRKEGRL